MTSYSNLPGESLAPMDPVDFEFIESSKLTKQQWAAVKQLKLVVYPPEMLPQRLHLWFMRRFGKAGRRYTWASPQWLVLMKAGDELITSVRISVREIVSNGDSKKIGGISGVMTHPAWRGRGLASSAMREAARRFHDELNVSYALLFCRPPLVPFYKRLQWKPFEGNVLADQPDGKFNLRSKGPMVLDIREQAPLTGTLDLNGLPW